MVRIWGNWCGPNWTDGKPISAQEYVRNGGDFTGPAVDRLDRACRDHDRDCSSPLGCSRAADARLIQTARRIVQNPINRFRNPQQYRAASIVLIGISAAKQTRRR